MQKVQPVPHDLHVVTMISNQRRFASRYRLWQQFAKHMADSGALLTTVEIAYGDREFELPDTCIRLRTHSEVWHKENALNIAISRLPSNWKYVAWIDADVQFIRPDWVAETVHMLQHHPIVQPWSIAHDHDPDYEPFPFGYRSFGWCYQQAISRYPKASPQEVLKIMEGTPNDPSLQSAYPGAAAGQTARTYYHSGYSWAARRDAIDHLGGLIDFAVMGSADHHMAHALVGNVRSTIPAGISQNYIDWLVDWQNRAEKFIQRNVGYVNGGITHFWHGKKVNRRYNDRWEILQRNGFDPALDLKRDWQGLWQLTDRSSRLRDDLMHYMSQRNEDGIDP